MECFITKLNLIYIKIGETLKNENDSEQSKKLLNYAYNCKLDDLKNLLKEIEFELEKNKNNQTALRAKRVVTSRMASAKN